jgi:hypothetical protein
MVGMVRLPWFGARRRPDAWRPDLYMFVEEIGELASSLQHEHEHAAWCELMQIGGITANWLADLIEENGDTEIVAFIKSLEGDIKNEAKNQS